MSCRNDKPPIKVGDGPAVVSCVRPMPLPVSIWKESMMAIARLGLVSFSKSGRGVRRLPESAGGEHAIDISLVGRDLTVMLGIVQRARHYCKERGRKTNFLFQIFWSGRAFGVLVGGWGWHKYQMSASAHPTQSLTYAAIVMCSNRDYSPRRWLPYVCRRFQLVGSAG